MKKEFLIKKLENLQEYLMINCPPRIPLTKMRYVINMSKGIIIFLCYFLIYIYSNYTIRSMIYLSLHGSYGLIWILKDYYFPDKTFDRKISLGSSLFVLFFSSLYYFIPYYNFNHL